MCREDGSQGLLALSRVGLPHMLTNVDLARRSLRHPPGCLKPSWWTAVGAPQDEPDGRRLGLAMQWERTGRRAPSTLAAGDELPMKRTSQPHERTGAAATQRQEKGGTLLC